MKELAWVQAQVVAEVMAAMASQRGAATVQTVVQDEATEERAVVATEVRVAMEALPIVAEAVAVAMA